MSHVSKVTPDLDAAKLNRRLELQRLEVLLQVIAPDLKNKGTLEITLRDHP